MVMQILLSNLSWDVFIFCRMDVIFDRQMAIKLSGMSEKAYIRSFNSMQNGIGVKYVIH